MTSRAHGCIPHVLAVGLIFAASLYAASPVAPTKPLNVLFISVDDLRPELGCYGVAGIRTPNIDGLATRSVRFDHAYAQYPVCNPSRTSLLTGRYPTVTGVLDNRTWFGAAHPDWRTLPRWFKDHGYVSLRAGKIFHGGMDDFEAWTEGGQKRNFEGARMERESQKANESDRIVVLPGEGETHIDYQSTTLAIEYLNRYKDRPFFLAFGLTKPHSPPSAPQRFFDLYDPAKIPLPIDFAARPTQPPGFPKWSVPARNSDLFIERDASEDEARLVKRAYWASTSFMDAQVGRVLAELDRLKLRDNTIVVFWGDHGYHLGEKGKWSKHNSLFEIGTRVPLLVSVPGGAAHGRACDRVVELLSLYPTLVELCGLPQPEGLNGASIAPLVKNPQAPWNRPAYTVTLINGVLGRAVRTARWRYAEWDGGREGAFLFDRQSDPHELANLASDPAHAPAVTEMKALLAKLPGRTQ